MVRVFLTTHLPGYRLIFSRLDFKNTILLFSMLRLINVGQVGLRDSEGKRMPNGEHPGIHWNRLLHVNTNIGKGRPQDQIVCF